jgi:enoyl-CoA hydratase
MYHTTPAFDRFIEIAAKDGVNAAIAWRDAPFKQAES